MNPLAAAEAKLRNLAGCRGTPSDAQAMTGEECRLLAEELNRLRSEQKGNQDGR